eukprot:366367-Chlamydomonas_euryale.AAC.6
MAERRHVRGRAGRPRNRHSVLALQQPAGRAARAGGRQQHAGEASHGVRAYPRKEVVLQLCEPHLMQPFGSNLR